MIERIVNELAFCRDEINLLKARVQVLEGDD